MDSAAGTRRHLSGRARVGPGDLSAEVVLAADDRLVFAREHDPATGYDELVVREREP